MSNNVNRKLKLSRERKAWMKKVTTILHSKFCKLKRSRTIRRTVSGLNNTVSSILSHRSRKSRSKRHHLIFASPKKPSSSSLRRARTFFPVYVDDLYSIEQEGGISQVVQKENKNLYAEKAPGCSSSTELISTAISTTRANCRLGSTDDSRHPPPLAAASSSSSSLVLVDDQKATDEKLQGVDLKAEMFIARFWEEIRLQKQKSFEEYQDMLARGI